MSRKALVQAVFVSAIGLIVVAVLFPVFSQAKLGGKPNRFAAGCLNVIHHGELAEIRSVWKPCYLGVNQYRRMIRNEVVKVALSRGGSLRSGEKSSHAQREALLRFGGLLSDKQIDELLASAN